MRRGFSLLTAVIFLVLIATIGALALSFSTLNVKQTSDIYLREQADMLLQSATEYALLAISGHQINAANGCLNMIISEFQQAGNPVFNIIITMNYLGNGLPAGCNQFSATNIDTNDSNVTVVIDTIVASAAGVATEPIRLHRRTIQKP